MEQLDTETVWKFVNVVQVTNAAAIPNFEYHKEELLKLHVEAKDNCRFLTTLERHFKVKSGRDEENRKKKESRGVAVVLATYR